MIRRRIVPLIFLYAALIGVAPGLAGSLEVTVRDGDGRALEDRNLKIRSLAVAGQANIPFYRHRGRWHRTDTHGKVTFEGLGPGSYAVDVFVSSKEPYVRPSDNPFVPTPRITLFDDAENLTLDVQLWRGVRVTVGLDLPDDNTAGFQAVFRHPGSGLERASSFPGNRTSTERLLPAGVWDVTVVPRAGYLLVALDRDRVPLPGHSVRLDLLHEPAATFLTWTYVAPAEIEGVVVQDSGQVPAVDVVATLVEPGPWHQAALDRGGSIFERVTAGLDPFTGDYRMVVPDGSWRVQPAGPLLVSSEPEVVDLTLSPGETGRADFTVKLKSGSGGGLFIVQVDNKRGEELKAASVEVYDLADPANPLFSGVTGPEGSVDFDALDAGSYRIVAGHADYLEGRLLLSGYDPKDPEKPSMHTVVLPDGAEIRLQARDPAGESLAGVELKVERIGDDPETMLQAEGIPSAKRQRVAVTDQSGRTSVGGFYPGRYQARAKLRGELGIGSLIHLGFEDDRPRRELEIEIDGSEKVELYGRMLPAASLSASLMCSDGWDLPDTVAVRVLDAYGREDAADFDPDEPGESGREVTFADDGMLLVGRARDLLTVGPFEQGVYYLAVKPRDFDRWTWGFETHVAADAAKLQIDVANSSADLKGGKGPALGNVDLGQFLIECAPAIDLLPAVATGVPSNFPDVREIAVEARFIDLETHREVGRHRSITRRDGRVQLRRCPGGRLRLDLTLTHPHLLPVPTLDWQIEVELERGQYLEIVPEVEALGGSILMTGAGGSAVLKGPNDARRQLTFEQGKAEFASLVPGRYRIEVSGVAVSTAVHEPIQVWDNLEVRAGETLRLTLEP